ncbi:MAG: efflux RND transporter periplasmic adaptor subunit [Ruminococcaceae bacterium]|nr:efflux RND transporter periplasmic adaptor subunit [Oscillospiraceae bacterium]
MTMFHVKSDYSKKIRLIAGILVMLMALSFAGCDLFPTEEETLEPPLVKPQSVTYTTVPVERGDVVVQRKGNGSFVSISQYNLAFTERGGYLKEIYVVPGDKVTEGQLLAELDTDALLHDIEIQELNVERAELNYKRAKNNVDYTKDEKRLSEIDLEIQKIHLRDLYEELNKSRIYSPIDGVVNYLSTATRGDYVSARSTVVSVVDPTKVYFAFSTDDYFDFKIGAEVKIIVKKKEYVGRVIMTPSDAPVDGSAITKNAVLFEVEGLPDTITIGTSGSFELVTAKSEDCIVVAKNMVTKSSGDYYVYVLVDGIKTERQIEIGLVGGTGYEVLNGLEEGELLIQ